MNVFIRAGKNLTVIFWIGLRRSKNRSSEMVDVNFISRVEIGIGIQIIAIIAVLLSEHKVRKKMEGLSVSSAKKEGRDRKSNTYTYT